MLTKPCLTISFYSCVTVALVAVLSSSLSCLRISERFEDASAAERGGLFENGWLPDVLPKESGPILEVHDLDTNARCSRSDFPDTLTGEVERSLRQQGFDKYSGVLPELPFKVCPFSLKIAQSADIVLTRMNSSQQEFAAILKPPGALLFWADIFWEDKSEKKCFGCG